MAPITRTPTAFEETKFDLDVAGWFKRHVFSSFWKSVAAVLLVAANLLLIRVAYTAEPIELSYYFLTPTGQPTPLGEFILTITNAAFLTITVVGLWILGLALVVIGAGRRRWSGPVRWLHEKLYPGFFSTLTTLTTGLVLVFIIRSILAWAVFGASFESNPEIVKLLKPVIPGAVWGVIEANLQYFAVGQYPTDLLWRVGLTLGLVLGLAALSLLAWNFGSPLKSWRRGLVWAWLISLPLNYFILRGVPGVESGPWEVVPTLRWGGLLLTIVIAIFGIVVSFPIGLALALGRRSQVRGVPWLWLWGAIGLILYWVISGFPAEVTLNIPIIFRTPPVWTIELSAVGLAALQMVIMVSVCLIISRYTKANLIKTFCVVYIEVIRGVPLITVLFMAQIMLPIFLPRGVEIDNLVRIIVGVILFSAAYLAENVRGGLQAIPRGQYEAAGAIGLSTFQSMRLIILPQALRAVIPAIVGQFISLFKDTSLVSIVGLFELMGIAEAVVAQPQWFGLQRETYAFVAVVYWLFAFSMSTASRRLERKLGVGKY